MRPTLPLLDDHTSSGGRGKALQEQIATSLVPAQGHS